MRIIAKLFLLIPLLANAADYGGADKYPVQTKTGGAYIVTAESIPLKQDYDTAQKAESAAIALSLKCGCIVTVAQPVIAYKTEWRTAVKSSSSSSVSSKASSSKASSSIVPNLNGYIEWQAPTLRENGQKLERVESYHVRQKLKTQKNYAIYIIPGNLTRFDMDSTKGDALIAAQDYQGNLSEFVLIMIKQRVT